MSNYTPPDINSLPFTFTESGYVKPDFGAVNFDSTPITYSTADLGSAIQVMQMYTEETYTELKECPTIIVGYGSSGVPQILRLPCIYLGIRDILASVHGNPLHVDLRSELLGITAHIAGTADLLAAIKTLIPAQSDLPKTIHGWDHLDLQQYLHGYDTLDFASYVKTFTLDNYDLPSAIRVWYSIYSDLGGLIGGFKGYQIPIDLSVDIYGIPPSDLQGYLNVIEIKDLDSEIYPQKYKGFGYLSSYLKGNYRDFTDFTQVLHSWATLDLQNLIVCAHVQDLWVTIQGTWATDLSSTVYAVAPSNIYASIHGFDQRYITASIRGIYSPGHLLVSIYSIPPKDLPARVSGFIEIEAYKDLPGRLAGYYASDLWSTIYFIPPVDLQVTISASGGYKDLDVLIEPSVIFVRQSLFVNILESRILHSVINSSCFASGWKDISYSLYAFDKLDLRAIVFGRLTDEDNQKDLTSYINYGNMVEDTITIKTFVADRYIKLPIDRQRPSTTYTEDTLAVTFSSAFGNFKTIRREVLDLAATLQPVPPHSDLPSRIYAYRDPNYSLDTTVNVHKLHIIDRDNKDHDWRREIRVLFESVVPEYYYVHGSGDVYRKDWGKHFILYVEGFTDITGSASGIEKGKVRGKYVFNLSNYASIDEAVRDAIDRVGSLRRVDLPSFINSVEGIGNYSDLRSRILNIWTVSTSRGVYSSIIGISETISDLPSSIYSELYSSYLPVTIEGSYYPQPNPLAADFEFVAEDLTTTQTGSADFNFQEGVV